MHRWGGGLPGDIWPEAAWHHASIAKEEADTIEGINAGCPLGSMRTYPGGLKRRSRRFDRSMEKLREAVRLFVWHDNRGRRAINATPRVRNTLPLLF